MASSLMWPWLVKTANSLKDTMWFWLRPVLSSKICWRCRSCKTTHYWFTWGESSRKLQLKGFADGELFSSQNPTEIKTNPNLTQPITCKGTDQELSNGDFNFDHIVAIPKYLSADLQELTKQVNSMIIKSQNMIPNGKRRCTASICKVCGKEGAPQTIKDHVEAHHLEGVSLPCNTCGKTFR